MTARGLAFMGPLVPRVLDGSKTVTRRTSERAPAKVGDVLWIREAWRLAHIYDGRSGLEAIATTPGIPGVRYEADGGDLLWWGRLRSPRYLPRDLARPWRGEAVDVRREALGLLDDEDAIREGAREWAPDGPDGTPSELARALGRSVWSLDGVTWGASPAGAFLSGWERLHKRWEPDRMVWRVEWRPLAEKAEEGR